MSKYLEFRVLEQKPKTQVIEVISKHHDFRLGVIKWFGKWRRYALFPEPACFFDAECLNDIISYIEELRQKEKKGDNSEKTTDKQESKI